ncbi:MAG: hypothetical protein U9Q62_10945 [Campylobacterota bacterium]|nr:hypothetical protein [Campylobacterota bacterium]
MKKILLATALFATLVQAEDIVHYDKKEAKKSTVSKPNHPSTDLYGQK